MDRRKSAHGYTGGSGNKRRQHNNNTTTQNETTSKVPNASIISHHTTLQPGDYKNFNVKLSPTSPSKKRDNSNRNSSLCSDSKQKSGNSPTNTRKRLKQYNKSDLLYLYEGIEDEAALHQPKVNGLTINDIYQRVLEDIETSDSIIYKEYQTICEEPIMGNIYKTSDAKQNRYFDIPCLEDSRVVLRNCSRGNSYIHANYVDGYKHSKAYICCQGPKVETMEDFWHMIWQENVFVIAMLTKCMEDMKIKCVQYWPTEVGKNLEFGNYNVHCRSIKRSKAHDYVELCLSKPNVEQVRPIVHLQFHGWPDYGIPDECTSFLSYVNTMRKVQRGFITKNVKSGKIAWKGHPLGPPIVVHCSAGVGRSGTLCCVDICCRMIMDNGQTVDIEETVRLLRTQRAKSIQKPEQYFFTYASILTFGIQLNMLGSTKEERDRIIKIVDAATRQFKRRYDAALCVIK